MRNIEGRKVVWLGSGEMPSHLESATGRKGISDEAVTAETLAVRERLGEIDFKALEDSFHDMFSRLGIDSGQMNFFYPDQIDHGQNILLSSTIGAYSPVQNTLGIKLRNVDSHPNVVRENVKPGLFLTGALIHEETHATGRVECHFSETGSFVKLGYQHDTQQSSEPLFADFNEGVTELIAHDLLRSYAERTRKFTREETEYYIQLRRDLPMIALVEGFTFRLSQATGVPEHEITEKIKEGYFVENDFFQTSFKEYVQEALGPEYASQLARGDIVFRELPQRAPTTQWIRKAKAVLLKKFRNSRASS